MHPQQLSLASLSHSPQAASGRQPSGNTAQHVAAAGPFLNVQAVVLPTSPADGRLAGDPMAANMLATQIVVDSPAQAANTEHDDTEGPGTMNVALASPMSSSGSFSPQISGWSPTVNAQGNNPARNPRTGIPRLQLAAVAAAGTRTPEGPSQRGPSDPPSATSTGYSACGGDERAARGPGVMPGAVASPAVQGKGKGRSPNSQVLHPVQQLHTADQLKAPGNGNQPGRAAADRKMQVAQQSLSTVARSPIPIPKGMVSQRLSSLGFAASKAAAGTALEPSQGPPRSLKLRLPTPQHSHASPSSSQGWLEQDQITHLQSATIREAEIAAANASLEANERVDLEAAVITDMHLVQALELQVQTHEPEQGGHHAAAHSPASAAPYAALIGLAEVPTAEREQGHNAQSLATDTLHLCEEAPLALPLTVTGGTQAEPAAANNLPQVSSPAVVSGDGGVRTATFMSMKNLSTWPAALTCTHQVWAC